MICELWKQLPFAFDARHMESAAAAKQCRAARSQICPVTANNRLAAAGNLLESAGLNSHSRCRKQRAANHPLTLSANCPVVFFLIYFEVIKQYLKEITGGALRTNWEIS